MKGKTNSFRRPRRSRPGSSFIGLVLLAAGLAVMHRFFASPDPRGPSPFFWIGFLSPAACLLGLVILVRGLTGEEKAFSGRNLFTAGMAMLVLGIYPWAYTPLLIRDGGMEGSGMLGTLLFLFLVIPGIAAMIVGHRRKG